MLVAILVDSATAAGAESATRSAAVLVHGAAVVEVAERCGVLIAAAVHAEDVCVGVELTLLWGVSRTKIKAGYY